MTLDQEVDNDRRAAVLLSGQTWLDDAKRLVHQGNVRRIVVRNSHGETVAKLPVTAGVVAAVVAPAATALGALAALAVHCTIKVERPASPTTDGPGTEPEDQS
ncbi:DUF4342 domain-containing protein [Actinokineospora xionganensis]|uniref:DUF4342 domain-containing protein n=1 Tax=Actinokineospora xionganensis TaxID=2684470 RepID=A0ABR7L036_9PSEU|nr:DUF4342 domain-containing protein [Actinokineospora xionganensis]MBC6445883.1 DUF4342 domain-containing protein [Actinokineospora xionganensis]